MKTTLFTLATCLSIAMTGALAQTDSLLASGEIRKIDPENQKITIKHGYIKRLDMPAMTMVFSAKDKALLDGFAAGEKIQFDVEMENGKFTITKMKKTAP